MAYLLSGRLATPGQAVRAIPQWRILGNPAALDPTKHVQFTPALELNCVAFHNTLTLWSVELDERESMCQ